MAQKGNKRILILHSKFGDGHLQAARAIQEAIPLQQNQIETIVMDFMECLHPYIYPVSRYIFLKGVKNFPSIYGYLFHKTRENNSSKVFKSFYFLSMKRMLKLLREVQPTVVVSTFPLAAATMSMLKSHGLTNVPTVTVITDYTDHSFWIHPYSDQYIVGSDPVRQSLKSSGVLDSKIAVTGIPIRPEFSKTYNRNLLKEKYGLDPHLPTILVAGGGYGLLGNGLSDLLTLNSLSKKIQLIIVCGHNEKLKKQLTEGAKNSKHVILVTGYVDYIHELMALSDLMITKPGGLTTSEAMAMELPMLFYKTLPGQEQDNARFLIQAGVAIKSNNFNDLKNKLEKVLESPRLLADMRRRAKLYHTKRAAFDALDVIVQTN